MLLLLGVAQLCELRTLDAHPASNAASLFAWHSAAMGIAHAHFRHLFHREAGEAQTENILHRLKQHIVDARRDT